MAKKGKTLTNNITGEKITWLETSSETNGKRLSFDFEVAPKGYVPVSHIHPNQDEHFEIISGSLRLELNGKTLELKSGDRITVPKGQPHQWWNDSDTSPVKCKLAFEPALNTETFFEQFFGLANDGKTKTDGSPKFMQVMAMCNEYQLYISGPPIMVQKIMSFVLGGIASLLGFKKYYSKYSED